MADLNRASIMGRLGKDPEIRTTQSGDKVATLNLATSERWADKASGEKRERTEWHHVVVWGKMADTAEKYLRKGARVSVEGNIRTRKWQDKSGNDRWSTEIVLNGFSARLDIIDWPESGSASPAQDPAYGRDGMAPGRAQIEDDDDEIPF